MNSRLKRIYSTLLSLTLLFGTLASQMTTPPLALARQYTFGFGPQTYKSGYTYGNGVYFAPYTFTVYQSPDETAASISTFHWGRKTSGNSVDIESPNGDHHTTYADKTFFCFYPELDVAMLAVTGDDDKGWVEVIYDQANKKTGWVKLKEAPPSAVAQGNTQTATATSDLPAHFGVYQTWMEFMKLNAKASGVYWLSGVTEYNRSIRSKDEDTAKLIPITLMRDLKVRFIRGNWMLVEVLDFERNTPIGWVRWRDDDGNLMVFPNLSGQHMPIVTTAY
jgi:hypothetical protein